MGKLLNLPKHLLIVTLLLSVTAFSQIRVGPQLGGASTSNPVNYNNPKVYTIADIKVEGTEFLDHASLISLSGLRFGDQITIPGSEISDAIKKLWKQSILGDVSILIDKVEGNEVYLIIRLTERPKLTRYEFCGITSAQEGEIEDDIELIRGRILTDALLKNTELKIRNFFVEKGYLNTEITTYKQDDTLFTNGIKVIFEIDKKKKVRINDVNIIGNDEISEEILVAKMKKTNPHMRFTLLENALVSLFNTKPKDIVYFLTHKEEADFGKIRDYLYRHAKVNFFKSYKFLPEEFENDKNLLIQYYNSKGFRDGRIIRDSVYAINDREINIDIEVYEGNKYYFRNIEWKGNYIYSDEQLSQILGIDKGDVYDMDLIQKKLDFNPQGIDISGLYMNNGYLFFDIQPIEVKISNDSIDVEMRISEGEKAIVNKIIINGNDRTNERVIRREIRTIPGDFFSREKLIRTQRELANLGYFDPEQIGMQPMPNPADGTVDIQFDLVERSNDQIQLSGGFGGVFGFVGTLGVTFNNFSARELFKLGEKMQLPVGDGQRLSINGQWNTRTIQSYSVSFTEPWLGGRKPNSFTVALNYTIWRNFNWFTQENLGSLRNGGATISLGRRLNWPDNWFNMVNSVSLLQYRLEDFQLQQSRALGFRTGVSNAFTFNTTLSRNSIDQPFYPRKGSNVSLSVTATPPYSLFNNTDYNQLSKQAQNRWQEYHKWMFDFSFFNQLTEKLVINTRAHMGFIGTYSNRRPIGPFERFLLGGAGFIGQNNFIIGTDIIGLRGYPDQSLNPSNRAFITDNNADDLLEGGVVFSKYVMELRYPISLNPQATIFVLGYGEAGNNWGNYAEFRPFDLQKSAGFGARVFMPAFGMLGIDWAYGFDPVPGTNNISGSQFHFTIGQQLR